GTASARTRDSFCAQWVQATPSPPHRAPARPHRRGEPWRAGRPDAEAAGPVQGEVNRRTTSERRDSWYAARVERWLSSSSSAEAPAPEATAGVFLRGRSIRDAQRGAHRPRPARSHETIIGATWAPPVFRHSAGARGGLRPLIHRLVRRVPGELWLPGVQRDVRRRASQELPYSGLTGAQCAVTAGRVMRDIPVPRQGSGRQPRAARPAG